MIHFIVRASALLLFLLVVIQFLLGRFLYSCGAPPAGLYLHGLPQPVVNPPIVRFEFPQSTCQIAYFHGRGRPLPWNYYMLGPLYLQTGCTIIALEYCSLRFDAILESARDLTHCPEGMRCFFMCASMGCSIMLRSLDSTAAVSDLILENPPTSLAAVASFHLHDWIPSAALKVILGPDNDWEAPVPLPSHWRALLLTSEKDEIVPPHMSDALAGNGINATRVLLTRANHGDAPSHPLYLISIKHFIAGRASPSTMRQTNHTRDR